MKPSTKITHPSNSQPQKDAEGTMRDLLRMELGCDLSPETIRSGRGESLEIDGHSSSSRILCEMYAHIGFLKGSQPNKPMADAIKMALAEKWLGGKWRKLLAFADARAASTFQIGSWRAAAMKWLDVEVIVIPLGVRSESDVSKAQRRQNMGNTPK